MRLARIFFTYCLLFYLVPLFIRLFIQSLNDQAARKAGIFFRKACVTSAVLINPSWPSDYRERTKAWNIKYHACIDSSPGWSLRWIQERRWIKEECIDHELNKRSSSSSSQAVGTAITTPMGTRTNEGTVAMHACNEALRCNCGAADTRVSKAAAWLPSLVGPLARIREQSRWGILNSYWPGHTGRPLGAGRFIGGYTRIWGGIGAGFVARRGIVARKEAGVAGHAVTFN
jgi:hypothetical protein